MAEEKYEFEFRDKEGFALWQERMEAGAETPEPSQNGEAQYLVKVSELFAAGVRGRDAVANRIDQQQRKILPQRRDEDAVYRLYMKARRKLWKILTEPTAGPGD